MIVDWDCLAVVGAFVWLWFLLGGEEALENTIVEGDKNDAFLCCTHIGNYCFVPHEVVDVLAFPPFFEEFDAGGSPQDILDGLWRVALLYGFISFVGREGGIVKKGPDQLLVDIVHFVFIRVFDVVHNEDSAVL